MASAPGTPESTETSTRRAAISVGHWRMPAARAAKTRGFRDMIENRLRFRRTRGPVTSSGASFSPPTSTIQTTGGVRQQRAYIAPQGSIPERCAVGRSRVRKGAIAIPQAQGITKTTSDYQVEPTQPSCRTGRTYTAGYQSLYRALPSMTGRTPPFIDQPLHRGNSLERAVHRSTNDVLET